MSAADLRLILDVGKRRVVAGAIDWPGLDRWGTSEGGALEKLTTYLPRYAEVARRRNAMSRDGQGGLPASSSRRLLPIALAYLPVPIAGAVLSARWRVGASADGGPGDMFLRGTALTPPLFLPAVLVGAAAVAPRDGRVGRLGAGIVSVVAALFLAGSTANLPNDFKAADAAGTPRRLTASLAAIHVALALALLASAVPRLRRS